MLFVNCVCYAKTARCTDVKSRKICETFYLVSEFRGIYCQSSHWKYAAHDYHCSFSVSGGMMLIDFVDVSTTRRSPSLTSDIILSTPTMHGMLFSREKMAACE